MAIIEIYQDRKDILDWEYIFDAVWHDYIEILRDPVFTWLVDNKILVSIVTSSGERVKNCEHMVEPGYGFVYISSEMMYKNTEKYGFTGYNDGYTYLYFENDNDALAFKMAWI